MLRLVAVDDAAKHDPKRRRAKILYAIYIPEHPIRHPSSVGEIGSAIYLDLLREIW